VGDGANRVRAGPEGSSSRVECPLARCTAVVEKVLTEVGEMAAGLGKVLENAPEDMEK
jgi:hypothetical protein